MIPQSEIKGPGFLLHLLKSQVKSFRGEFAKKPAQQILVLCTVPNSAIFRRSHFVLCWFFAFSSLFFVGTPQ